MEGTPRETEFSGNGKKKKKKKRAALLKDGELFRARRVGFWKY